MNAQPQPEDMPEWSVENPLPPLNVVAFQHGDDDACTEALLRVHAFLSNELPATEADLIRAHLDACEKCLDDFDVEAMITRLLQRSCQGPAAPDDLRLRIMTMSITYVESDEPFDGQPGEESGEQ